MKPLLKIGLAVICVSAAGLSRLPAFAQPQPSGNQTEHQIAETSDGDGETNDDAKSSRAEQTQPALIHAVPTQMAEDLSEQSDTTMAEPPGGDGDGETNDDG